MSPAVPVNPACTRSDVAAVDAALVDGMSNRKAAEAFGLAASSVGRHRKSHLTLEGVEQDLAERTSGRMTPVEVHQALSALAARLAELITANLKRPDRATSLAALAREHRGTLEALARLQADPRLLSAAQAHYVQESLSTGVGEVLMTGLQQTLAMFLTEVGPTAGLGEAVRATLRGFLLAADAAPEGAPAPEVPQAAFEAWAAARRDRLTADAERFNAAVEAEVERRLQALLPPPLALTAGPSSAAWPSSLPDDDDKGVLDGDIVDEAERVITRLPARATPNSGIHFGAPRW